MNRIEGHVGSDRRKLSHNLPTIWDAFRVAFSDPSLDKFGTLVGSLHTFEDLRYPDSILAKGMAATFGVERPSAPFPSATTTPARNEPTYELYLQDVDALMDKLFEVASINLMSFLPGLRPHARQFLRDGNTSRWGTL